MASNELHPFLFDGLPVRGQIVRLTDAWTQMLARRAANTDTGAYPTPVQNLLGEMTAAALLMQSNIKFNGALVLQVLGDGPLKLAVVEVQPDLSVRATATLVGTVAADATLSQMVNVNNGGRCAITLDPVDRLPGQQPYQGVVPLWDDRGEKIERFSAVLEHYMLQSEQLDTCLVLAANAEVAAGLLIQRLPAQGIHNLQGVVRADEDEMGRSEDYQRIATLAASLTSEELLALGVESILHRLFWDEKLLRFVPESGVRSPQFSCRCSRERVARMLHGLGQAEIDGLLTERGQVEVGCDFCGLQYRFDAVDAAQIFKTNGAVGSAGAGLH